MNITTPSHITLKRQAISSMVYFMLKHNKLDSCYVHDELLSFYVSVDSALKRNDQDSLNLLEEVLINELLEGSYFEDPNFMDDFVHMLSQCATENVFNHIVDIVFQARKMFNEESTEDAKKNPKDAGVDIGKDYISIFDKHGEIVRWVDDEWNEDPDIVVSVANALKIAYTRGSEALRGKIGSKSNCTEKMINELDHKTLAKLIEAYDMYIIENTDRLKDGWVPVCVEEFLNNEFMLFEMEEECYDNYQDEHKEERIKQMTFRNEGEYYFFLSSLANEMGADCEYCFERTGVENFDVTPYGLSSDGAGGLFVLAKCNTCGAKLEVGDGDYFTETNR